MILASDKNLKYYEILKALASAPRSSWVASPDLQAHPDHLLQQFRHLSDWKKTSSSTFCCTISSLDCRFGWERLSFSAGALFCKAGNALPGTSLNKALRIRKHTVLEISQVNVQGSKAQWAYYVECCSGISSPPTMRLKAHQSGERIVLRLSASQA